VSVLKLPLSLQELASSAPTVLSCLHVHVYAFEFVIGTRQHPRFGALLGGLYLSIEYGSKIRCRCALAGDDAPEPGSVAPCFQAFTGPPRAGQDCHDKLKGSGSS
jgi:hypothetical protein